MHLDWLKSLRSSPQSRRKTSHLTTPSVLESRNLLSAVPIGPEFQVNSWTTDVQGVTSIGMDSDGDYVIAWNSSSQDGSSTGIYAQRYNAAGLPQGSEFRVNTWTSGQQSYPEVGMDADGDFVVTWASGGQDGSNFGVYAQRYNAAGVPQGSEFHVSSYTTGNQWLPAIDMDADGDFVITWQSYTQDGSIDGIYAQRYDAFGIPQGSEFRVNSYTTSNQSYPAIAMDVDGDFVITWSSDQQDGSSNGIYAQRYNAAGVPQGSEFRINSWTTNNQTKPSIGMDANGDFVIGWQSSGQGGAGLEVYAQRYNAAGVAQGSEFHVNSWTTSWQENVSVGMDAEGDFVLTWHSNIQDGSNQGIYARLYNAEGAPLGNEFQVNTWTTNNQSDPRIGIDSDGEFVVTWSSENQDGSLYGVIAQRYRTSHPDNLAAWRSGKFYLDSNHNALWNGSTTDTLNTFGASTDKPLAGDWNADGYTDIGAWRNGTFYLDANGNGLWDGPAIDKQFVFGLNTDTPLVGDWNADGKDDIGVWRAGKFYLDLDANRAWNSALDGLFTFGSATDTPLIGDWNADGKDDLGIWRSGKFYLDLDANRTWNSGIDGIFTFGLNTDTPLIGDWNGDGTDDLGVWRSGKFYQDTNGNRVWNSASDTVTTYGAATDTPLIGYWRPKNIPGSPPAAAPLPTTGISNPSPLAINSPSPNKPGQPDGATLASLLAPPRRRYTP